MQELTIPTPTIEELIWRKNSGGYQLVSNDHDRDDHYTHHCLVIADQDGTHWQTNYQRGYGEGDFGAEFNNTTTEGVRFTRLGPPADYTPKAGDLARDAEGDVWFIYSDPDYPDKLYGITTSYDPSATGHPIDDAQRLWGPLTLEHRLP